jgi:hypothetical protein
VDDATGLPANEAFFCKLKAKAGMEAMADFLRKSRRSKLVGIIDLYL